MTNTEINDLIARAHALSDQITETLGDDEAWLYS
jgi:hypothetical protein